MGDRTEAIEDIVREMRSIDYGVVENDFARFADRIEKAYNRQRQDGSLCTMSCRESGELLNQYMEENKRLRAALKPVLEVEYSGLELDFMCSAADAVREAQRVYKEVAK